jgi:two-component system sensor histidine kinase AlgZ
VLIVNAVTAVAALVREPQLDLWAAQWLDLSSTVEPHLIIVLAVLYALSPWLLRQSPVMGTLLVAALTIATGMAVYALLPHEGVQPPFALFRYLVLALLLSGGLICYFALRAKAMSPAIAESRLQALQARIRPHFLFNSINAVLSLVRSDPKQAETALMDMADLFRVLMRDNRELVPIGDEIELCREYLALEKLRLTDRLQVEWHLNSMPADAMVPPLLLQPLLENAVYHGIEPSSTPGVISINIFSKGGDVHAILRNPYQATGGRHHSGNKMALANIRERLKLHFDTEGTLESTVLENAYEVHIRLPYRPAKSTVRDEGAVPTERREQKRDSGPQRPSAGERVLGDGKSGTSHV